MIKILNVIGSLKIGGAENNAMNLIRNLTNEEISYYFLVFDVGEGDYEEEARSLGATIVNLDEPKKNYRIFITNFTNLLEKEKFDAIHVNTLWNSGLLLKIAKNKNIPIRICHSHSTESSQNENIPYKVYKHMMRSSIIKNATYYVACGEAAGSYLYGEKTFKEKGITIYNGINIDKFHFDSKVRDSIRKEIGIQEETFLMGHVGRIAPVKNHSFMVTVLDELKIKMPDLKLAIIGDGPDTAFIKEMVKTKGLEERVIFLGNKKNVAEYLQAMDLFIFPSLFEGFPVSTIEAQAAGLPCLISDQVTKEAELTHYTHFLNLKTINSWMDKIQYYSENELIRSEVNIDTIRNNFDIKNLVKLWEELYRGEFPIV